MGYSGAKLTSMFSPDLSEFAAVAIANAGADLILSEVKQNTPIDDSPFPSRPPGTARAAWHKKPFTSSKVGSAWHYNTGVETEDKVAVYLEYGTGLYGPHHTAYKITPKNPGGMLRFYWRRYGAWYTLPSVTHPGIHPQRPLATAMALAETRLPAHVEPIMQTWIRAAELKAKTGR